MTKSIKCCSRLPKQHSICTMYVLFPLLSDSETNLPARTHMYTHVHTHAPHHAGAIPPAALPQQPPFTPRPPFSIMGPTLRPGCPQGPCIYCGKERTNILDFFVVKERGQSNTSFSCGKIKDRRSLGSRRWVHSGCLRMGVALLLLGL